VKQSLQEALLRLPLLWFVRLPDKNRQLAVLAVGHRVERVLIERL
jgi:hypothetical protein